MTQLRRARLSLLAALLGLASAVLVFELPVGELLHQRGELATVSSELAAVEARNKTLSTDVASLRQSSTVAAIAHAEYGLVHPGQRAYSVLARGSATGATAAALVQQRVPEIDLVAPSVDALAAPGSPARDGNGDGTSTSGSVWSRALDRLEFWRWAF